MNNTKTILSYPMIHGRSEREHRAHLGGAYMGEVRENIGHTSEVYTYG